MSTQNIGSGSQIHIPDQTKPINNSQSGAFKNRKVTKLPPRLTVQTPVNHHNKPNATHFFERKVDLSPAVGILVDLSEPTVDRASRANIVKGLDNVANHELQGIPTDLLNKLMQGADSRGAALFTRPVEPICRTLLSEGWPTKHFQIKGKSSNWGAQAGTIPVNQQYSKLALDTGGKIEKYSRLTNEMLNKKGEESTAVTSTPLKISPSRLDELENKGYLYGRKEEVLPDGTNSIRFQCRLCNQPDAPERTQLLKQEADGNWSVYDADTPTPTPIMVLAQSSPEAAPLPITADIDPLMESFPMEELDLAGADKLPLKLVSDQVVKNTVDKYRKRAKRQFVQQQITGSELDKKLKALDKKEAELLQDFYTQEDASGRKTSREDENMGNVTQRTRDMIKHYDQALGRKHRVIHHNVDAHSLATDEKANYPITAFFPKALNMQDDICMIFNEEQLISVLVKLVDRGYAIEKNPLWGKASINSSSFEDAKARLSVSMGARIDSQKEFVDQLEEMTFSGSFSSDKSSTSDDSIRSTRSGSDSGIDSLSDLDFDSDSDSVFD